MPDLPLLIALQHRFQANKQRHPTVDWLEFRERLEASSGALAALMAMEASGGEPDVLGAPDTDGRLLVVDCAPESPAGRRSLCYDAAALDARKEHRPVGSAVDMAAAMGVQLLDEKDYRMLQEVACVDNKTSSWLHTPPELRALGGALFGDRRYGRVFIYHNGAQSYYGARGFRGKVRF